MCESTTLEFIRESPFYYLIAYRMTDNRKFLTKFAFSNKATCSYVY